jgi:hypothetical protein
VELVNRSDGPRDALRGRKISLLWTVMWVTTLVLLSLELNFSPRVLNH